MAKLDWGKKHICSECSTKFYDMNKPTPECPKCGSQIVISRKPRVGRPPLSKNKMAKDAVSKKENIPINKKNELESNLYKNSPQIEKEEPIEDIEEIEEIEEIENIEEIEEIEEIENIEDIEDIEDSSKNSLPDKTEPQ